VIQFILQHGDDDDKARVLAKVRGSVVELSKNQYASHVCEKAMTHSGAQNRSLLIGEILTDTGDGHPIPSMMQGDFASEPSSATTRLCSNL
jgi:pumilio RNA-binding family